MAKAKKTETTQRSSRLPTIVKRYSVTSKKTGKKLAKRTARKKGGSLESRRKREPKTYTTNQWGMDTLERMDQILKSQVLTDPQYQKLHKQMTNFQKDLFDKSMSDADVNGYIERFDRSLPWSGERP